MGTAMDHNIDNLTVRELGNVANECGVSAASLITECEPQRGS